MTDAEIRAARVRVVEDERAAAVNQYEDACNRLAQIDVARNKVIAEREAAWSRLARANVDLHALMCADDPPHIANAMGELFTMPRRR